MDNVFERNRPVEFSVIMPCYNSSAYVRDAIDSLLAQSYPYWKLVAVNDGSKDDTLDILNGYSQKDSRIRVYSKENGGYATAINYGLDRISGDYFLMMGSDDRLASNLFEDIVKHIKERQPDLIAFRAVKYIAGKRIGVDEITNFDTAVSMFSAKINEFAKKYPKHAQILNVRDTAKCFRTELLGDLRYFGKYGYDADGVFSSLFAHKCCSFMSIPIDGYLWTLRDDSVSAKTNSKIDIDRIKVWTEYNYAVLHSDDFEPTEQEQAYFSRAQGIAMLVLSEKSQLDTELKETIYIALKSSFAVYKKYGIERHLPKGKIKRFVFVNMPKIWMWYFVLRKRFMGIRGLIP